ncbi:unnamed protein product [Clonostachys byssicola]|uniref:Uncharacterized protein n=1 Tax=Clonostachys byssicola TaxID=160290 RepID=A0A9N9UU78_9HYPO|nr:unnamed protein product [Clonostachys byssicola]
MILFAAIRMNAINGYNLELLRAELLMRILQRPSMVMREWSEIMINAKRNNEREVYNARVGLFGPYRGKSVVV